MNIQDRQQNIGAAANSNSALGPLLSDKNRQDEVQRLAHKVAGEHFGTIAQQPNPQNGNSSQVDNVKISSEALEELSSSGKANNINSMSELITALQENFQTRANDNHKPNSGTGEAQAGGAAEGQSVQPQKRKEKKQTTHWEPIAQANQLHPEGHEVIGKITIKEEVREVDAAGEASASSNQPSRRQPSASASSPASGNSQAVSGVGSASASSNGNSAASASGGSDSSIGDYSSSQSSPSSPNDKNDKDGQKVQDDQGKQDKEGAAMAQSLKSQGLKVADDIAKGAGASSSGSSSKEFDVRSPATGASQTLTIRSAGNLEGGEAKLGTYKKLDDSPAYKYVSLHSRGQSLDDTAKEYAQQAKADGENPEQIAENTKKLKRTTPDE